MKAISFFCCVFFGMLLVFLVATGEVKRWFTPRPEAAYHIVREPAETAGDPRGNKLHFDFFNVKTGEKLFTLEAQLSQENLQVGTKVDEINELALRDGFIRIPLGDGIELETGGDAETPQEKSFREFVLRFQSAVWRQGGSAGRSGEPMSVLLKDGVGRANDGTEILFEELTFRNSDREGGDGAARLTSTRPVSIRNPLLELKSANGLDGTLRGGVLQSLTFRPPVVALLDADRAGGGGHVAPPGASPPAAVAPGGGGENVEAGAATEAGSAPEVGPPLPPAKLAISCQGHLEVDFGGQGSGGAAGSPEKAGENPVTRIRFLKDVTVAGARNLDEAAAGPAPDASHFQCQELVLEVAKLAGAEGAGFRLAPQRVVATWQGGRVKGYFRRETAAYEVDGERLEWNRPAGVQAGMGSLFAGEAVLSGHPTLRQAGGEGMFFEAERALVRLAEESVVYEAVRGTLDFSTKLERREKKRRVGAADARTAPRPGGRGPEKEDSDGAAARTDGGPGLKGSLPRLWDVKADEVEFFFRNDPAAGRRELESFVARSGKPDGVEIRSRPGTAGEPGSQSPAGDAAEGGKPEERFSAVANRLTYVEEGRRATLEGTPEVKPRLARGESWMVARRIHLHPDDGIAVLEDEARAHLEDLDRWGGAGEAPGAPAEEKKTPGRQLPSNLDLEAEVAEAGFEQGGGELSYLKATSRGAGSFVVLSSAAEPPFRLVGRELFWDEKDGTAVFHAKPTRRPEDEGAIGPMPVDQLARFETANGDLLADTIRFERGAWKATLTDEVAIRTFQQKVAPGAEARRDAPARLEMKSGQAVLEFFEKFAEGAGGEAQGFAADLRHLKALHATRSPAGPLEIRGEQFVGRGEEAAWNWESRELRFTGKGPQEIEILRDDFRGPLYAREIVYQADKDRALARGEVRGRFVQARPARPGGTAAGEARIEPAALGKQPQELNPAEAKQAAAAGTSRGAKEKEPLVWWFETDVLEVQLKPRASDKVSDRKAMDLESLQARDRVLIRNEEHGLQLRGDHLAYEEATRRLRLFSPDGRTQTLLRRLTGTAAAAAPPAAEPPGEREKVDKIDAQEIYLVYEDPAASYTGRGARRLLLVEFQRDVIATFELAPLGVKDPPEGLGDKWKMLADSLILYVDPDQPGGVPQAIPRAVARGKVVFQAGDYEATAERAVYEEATSRLTLLGGQGSPARLFRKKKAVTERDRIYLERVGEGWQYREP